jgi:signal transduction histidine kinase
MRGPLSLLSKLLEEGNSLLLHTVDFRQGNRLILSQEFELLSGYRISKSLGFATSFSRHLGDFEASGTVVPSDFNLLMVLLESALIAGLVYLIAQVFEWHYRLRFNEELSAKRSELARQVSHDIRSPLSALNMVVASLKDLPEDKRLIIRSAAQRINDIANGLLQQSKKSGGLTASSSQAKTPTPDTPTEPQMLVALLDAIVSEKRIQYRERLEIEILADLNQGYGLFTHVHPAEFVRVISNLVNNAVEAMPNGLGERVTVAVTVAIRGYKDQVAVIVSDNGKGIPADVLARLGERGVTHGKEGTQSGSGLGVSHARETVERDGGKFSIQSQVGVGTQVTLTFPRAETPKWFVEKILIQPNTVITSLDDDQTIHQLWADRLSSAGAAKANVQHVAFSSLEQFMTWAKEHDTNAALFFVDYEFLAQAGNGLDAIEQTGIASRAILVTSRHEEPHVRARAEALSVRVLPKALAPLVPLAIENS